MFDPTKPIAEKTRGGNPLRNVTQNSAGFWNGECFYGGQWNKASWYPDGSYTDRPHMLDLQNAAPSPVDWWNAGERWLA